MHGFVASWYQNTLCSSFFRKGPYSKKGQKGTQEPILSVEALSTIITLITTSHDPSTNQYGLCYFWV